MPRSEPPPTMLDPTQLAPGDSWEWDCDIEMAGTTAAGQFVRRKCETRTQGGYPGLQAHQRVVHGVRPLAG